MNKVGDPGRKFYHRNAFDSSLLMSVFPFKIFEVAKKICTVDRTLKDLWLPAKILFSLVMPVEVMPFFSFDK